MGCLLKRSPLAWLGLGLLVGLMIGGLWPHVPLHAVATDRAENITIATGFVDDQVEAIFFLDSLTGTLIGGVPARQRRGAAFQSMWQANVNADLLGMMKGISAAKSGRRGAGGTVEVPKTPRYMMVTGALDIRGLAAAQEAPGRCLVYVVEANTGVVLSYMVPWSANRHNTGALYRAQLSLWAADQFATAVIREE
jgi:hypothetical protein